MSNRNAAIEAANPLDFGYVACISAVGDGAWLLLTGMREQASTRCKSLRSKPASRPLDERGGYCPTGRESERGEAVGQARETGIRCRDANHLRAITGRCRPPRRRACRP